MNARALLGILAAIAVGLTTACAKPSLPSSRQPADLIVLLPDPDSSTVGHATVSNDAGQVELSSAREAATVTRDRAPRQADRMSEAEVERVFGSALAALPDPPLSFTLFFRFDSEELTPDSRTLAQEVLRKVRARTFPEVMVVGHTDTTGSRERNVELGMKRANTVRLLLIEIGLDSSAIQLASHGEAEPLVATADEVFEPRNRRVEITIR